MDERPDEHAEEVEDAESEQFPTAPDAVEVEDSPETLDDQLAQMSPEQRVDFLEEHLIEQGNWLEAQLQAEEDSRYKKCPVCSASQAVIRAMLNLLQETLEHIDEKRAIERPGLAHELAEMLTIAVKFNHANRTTLLTMHQCAHQPWSILSAHPDLKGPTRQRKADASKKKARKKSRTSRRRNK